MEYILTFHILNVYVDKTQPRQFKFTFKKSVCMVIKSGKYKITNLPWVYLAGVLLENVERYKYLGMQRAFMYEMMIMTSLDNSDL